jgi:Na+-translocating ferredoxin:NAD+ oxidoreductase RnfG subunit
MKILKYIFIGFLVLIVFSCVMGTIINTAQNQNTPTTVAEGVRQHHQIAGMAADRAATVGVLSKTLDSLRDPRSIEITDLYSYDDDKVAIGCMEYRSKNGFGGMVQSYSTWVMNGTKFSFTIQNSEMWNTWCANNKYHYDSRKYFIEKAQELARKS